MSRLDRQLDEVYGEERVVVRWRENDDRDIDELRTFLMGQIDSHKQRIPLDLRSVDGAPPELVNLLLDCQVYARSCGKAISISYALPPMQDALRGKPRRSAATKQKSEGDAGNVAEKILEEQVEDRDPFDLSKAEVIEKPKKRRKQPVPWRRYSWMAGVVLLGFSAIAAVECYVIFNNPVSTVKVPSKTYENNQDPLILPKGTRVWRDAWNTFQIEAKLMKVGPTQIRLKSKEGLDVTIDIDDLCDDDQSYLRSNNLIGR